jgi:multicomponent Na+:H+ antiporter subunit F
MTGAAFLSLAVDVSFWLVMIGVILGFVRLARGPSLPDRVVALDMMTILIAAFCGIFSLFSGDIAFLDVAIVLALIGFLATVALARFAERRQADADEADDAEGGR